MAVFYYQEALKLPVYLKQKGIVDMVRKHIGVFIYNQSIKRSLLNTSTLHGFEIAHGAMGRRIDPSWWTH